MIAIKPWGIMSSIAILCIWGLAFLIESFNETEEIFLWIFLVGMLLLITNIGLYHQDSIAWWITLFMAVIIPVLSLFIFTEHIPIIIAGILSGILLLFCLTHRETIKAMQLEIKYEGWIFEE